MYQRQSPRQQQRQQAGRPASPASPMLSARRTSSNVAAAPSSAFTFGVAGARGGRRAASPTPASSSSSPRRRTNAATPFSGARTPPPQQQSPRSFGLAAGTGVSNAGGATSFVPNLGGAPLRRNDSATTAGFGDRLVGAVFPSLAKDLSYKQVRNREILSSTLFQQLLYYHMYFSLVTLAVLGFTLWWKTHHSRTVMTRAVMPAALVAWALVEMYRLFLGWSGNLRERVPQLAAFIFVCVFPQLLLTIFFIAVQRPVLPIDRIFWALHLVLLVLEMYVAWRATNVMITAKTARFPVEFGGWLGAGDVVTEDPAVAAANAAIVAALRENDEIAAAGPAADDAYARGNDDLEEKRAGGFRDATSVASSFAGSQSSGGSRSNARGAYRGRVGAGIASSAASADGDDDEDGDAMSSYSVVQDDLSVASEDTRRR